MSPCAKKGVSPHLPPSQDYEPLRKLVSHHIHSFDYMLDYGIEKIMMNINPVEVVDSLSNQKLRKVYPPQKVHSSRTMRDTLFPSECRQSKSSYTGKLLADVCFKYGDGPGGAVIREKFNLGQLPIMLKSKLCNLRDFGPTELISCNEESSEVGGYFIVNGLEKVIRLLIMPKRNYPTSMVRNSFRDRQQGYTDKAVVIRCVREDQSAVTLKLYYLINGSARVGFWVRGRKFMLPVGIVLKPFRIINNCRGSVRAVAERWETLNGEIRKRLRTSGLSPSSTAWRASGGMLMCSRLSGSGGRIVPKPCV